MMAHVEQGVARLVSGNGTDFSQRSPEVTEALKKIKVDCCRSRVTASVCSRPPVASRRDC
jgi:hypothetical protein